MTILYIMVQSHALWDFFFGYVIDLVEFRLVIIT